MFFKAKSQKSKAKRVFLNLLLPIAYCLLPIATNAQCAMCRATLQSEGNATKAQAVNDGIVFLMAVPYILVVLVSYIIYRMYKEKK